MKAIDRTGMCPSGYEPIRTVKECESASKLLKLRNRKGHRAKPWTRFSRYIPSGCWIYNNELRFCNDPHRWNFNANNHHVYVICKNKEMGKTVKKAEIVKTFDAVEDWLLLMKYKILLADAADETTSDCAEETNQLIDILWQTLDPNNDGRIDRKVFLEACDCEGLMGEAKYFFEKYDADKDGTISRTEFEKEMGTCMKKESRQTMLRWMMKIQEGLTTDVGTDINEIWEGLSEWIPKLREKTKNLDKSIRRHLEENDSDYEL